MHKFGIGLEELIVIVVLCLGITAVAAGLLFLFAAHSHKRPQVDFLNTATGTTRLIDKFRECTTDNAILQKRLWMYENRR